MDLDQRQVTCIFKLVCKDLETILQEAMAVLVSASCCYMPARGCYVTAEQ